MSVGERRRRVAASDGVGLAVVEMLATGEYQALARERGAEFRIALPIALEAAA